jgi:outer membrane lipoprotein-sorting protein
MNFVKGLGRIIFRQNNLYQLLGKNHFATKSFCLNLFLLGLVFQVGATEDSAALLQRLEKSFSGIKTVQARLRQEKKLKIFDRTVVMEGRISLENPDKLAWRIDTPIQYALVINGKYALQWDEDSNKVQKMKTAGDPVFEEVIGQIEKWFSGEFSSLLDEYNLTVKSTEPLILEFVPKADGMLSKVIAKLTIHVRADLRYVEQISI